MPIPKGKEKFPLWLKPDTLESVKMLYKSFDCKSQSEFIENAILFYIGYLTAESKENFLPNIFLSNLKSVMAESDNRTCRLLFKVAVELAMMQNIVAATNDVDEEGLARLRGACIEDVKKMGGMLTFEDAVKWQKD